MRFYLPIFFFTILSWTLQSNLYNVSHAFFRFLNSVREIGHIEALTIFAFISACYFLCSITDFISHHTGCFDMIIRSGQHFPNSLNGFIDDG